MTDKSLSERLEDVRRALTCLYIAVESSVADDVKQKVEAALAEQQREIERLRADLTLNAKMLARQCDLALEAETQVAEQQREIGRLNTELERRFERMEQENALLRRSLEMLGRTEQEPR